MEFDDYLKGKKIDPVEFIGASEKLYQEWKVFFDQVHPDSFTQQKLFLINNLRRTYPFKHMVQETKTSAPKAIRPKIKPLKPKTN